MQSLWICVQLPYAISQMCQWQQNQQTLKWLRHTSLIAMVTFWVRHRHTFHRVIQHIVTIGFLKMHLQMNSMLGRYRPRAGKKASCLTVVCSIWQSYHMVTKFLLLRLPGYLNLVPIVGLLLMSQCRNNCYSHQSVQEVSGEKKLLQHRSTLPRWAASSWWLPCGIRCREVYFADVISSQRNCCLDKGCNVGCAALTVSCCWEQGSCSHETHSAE